MADGEIGSSNLSFNLVALRLGDSVFHDLLIQMVESFL